MSEDDSNLEEEIDFEQDGEMMDDQVREQVLPPNSFKRGLQACTSCYLILSQAQWKSYESCPNCGDDVISRKPTAKFTGITCITNPEKSWQTTRMRVVKQISKKIKKEMIYNK